MDFFETITTRRSIRAFQATDIESHQLNAILAAAMQAPSAGNLQAFRVYVVRDAQRKRALATAALNQDFMAGAPVVLVFCADRERSGKHYRKRGEDLYSLQDATIATAYAQLAATALGLATCWIGAFDEDQVERLMDVPPAQRPIALLPVGYAAETSSQAPRRSLEEMVVDEKN